MRLLKARQSAVAPATAAADVRLRAIAGRGKAEQSSYPNEPLDVPLPRERLTPRLFWTPEELAELRQ